jgi:hypothetical protein
MDGTVTDQSGAALPGVTVEITSPNLQGPRRATTGADGRYLFPALPPGTYTVTGSLAGFGKVEKKAQVSLERRASVFLQLALSTTAEVTVTGEAPLVDSTSTTTGSNYNAALINKLPLGRNYAEVAFAQPGVQADFGETQGRSLAISVYGSTSSENLFLIDGVNTTNVIKAFQGKDINGEFIQEVEVKTGGYQAEYGRNTGGVVNVITKSGGNEFHGGGFAYYNDTGMRANVKDDITTPAYSETGDVVFQNSILSKDVREEWGFDLGGFAVKDKVWFFGAYNRVLLNQSIQALDPDNPLVGQDVGANFFQNKYSGKLTFNLLQGTTIVGSIFSDSQTQQGALTTTVPFMTNVNTASVPYSVSANTYAGRRDTGGPDYGARLNQLFGNFGIFTFQYAKHSDRYTTKPATDDPQFRDYTVNPPFFTLPALVQLPSGARVFNGFGNVFGPTTNNSSNRNAYGGAFTAYVQNHEIKVGGDYQSDVTFGATFFTGGQRGRVRPCNGSFGVTSTTSICDPSVAPSYTNSKGNTGQVFYQHDLLANGTVNSFTILDQSPFSTPSKRWSAYLQDQWRIMPALTVNLGVRYDSEKFYGQCPAGPNPCGPDNTPGGDNFLAFSMADQWAPRVGVVWDFMGDGTSKAYASAGRFYYALPTDLNVRVFTANSSVTAFNYDPFSTTQSPGPAGTGTNGNAPRNQLFQGGDASGEPVDAGMKAAYQDEFTIGVEKAIDPTLSVSLKGTYRTLGRTVEDRCDLDSSAPPPRGAPSSCALYNPGGTGPAATGQYDLCNGTGNPTDPTFGECGIADTSVGPAKRIFRGIELVGRKQFSSEIWAQASFLYSSLRGNYSGAIREASGQTDPGINADFDYYQFTQNAYGTLDLDRPVQARIDGVYNAPFGLSAGLGFYVRSGLPLSQQAFFNSFYPDLLLPNGRATLGRTPTDYDLNLSLSYNYNIGPVTITPMVYLFNVINKQFAYVTDQTFNPAGSFVTNTASPFYGQAGVEPGTARPDGSICNSSTPCSDNPDYNKTGQRNNPRLFRAALKITF